MAETRGGVEVGGTRASRVRACRFARAFEIKGDGGAATDLLPKTDRCRGLGYEGNCRPAPGARRVFLPLIRALAAFETFFVPVASGSCSSSDESLSVSLVSSERSDEPVEVEGRAAAEGDILVPTRLRDTFANEGAGREGDFDFLMEPTLLREVIQADHGLEAFVGVAVADVCSSEERGVEGIEDDASLDPLTLLPVFR